MRVHHRDPRSDGVVVTNPPDAVRFVANSSSQGATVLLAGQNLVASTISCTSHCDTRTWAGLEDDYHRLGVDDPSVNIHRAGMNASGLTVEVWSDLNLDGDLPYSMDDLQALYDFMCDHPRLRRRPDGFELDIVIYDEDCLQVYVFNQWGLSAYGSDGDPAPASVVDGSAPVSA